MVLIGLYFLKCTIFDQLILRKIIKIVATRCQILTLKCTKIDFGWGSPAPLAAFKGPTSKGKGRDGRAGKGRAGALDLSASSFCQSWLPACEGREREGRRGREGKGRGGEREEGGREGERDGRGKGT